MSDSKAYIRDYQSLVDLNNTLEFGADSILNVLEQVNNYLQGVLQMLKRQLQMLENELHYAEDKLYSAEQNLRSCEMSQQWDEQSKEYRPSCKFEAGQVTIARSLCNRCEERVKHAREIVRKCEIEIEEYKKPGGFVTPAGGEKLMQELAQDHTDRATEKMREILDVVDEYLGSNMSIKKCGVAVSQVVSSEKYEHESVLTPEQKKNRFTNAIHDVIDRMQRENNAVEQKAVPNVSIICPNCKRARVACVCPRQREKEYVRDNMQFIKDDFLR